MKSGPILAMVALLLVGMALVLQPTLARGSFDLVVDTGESELRVVHAPSGEGYSITSPARFATAEPMTEDAFWSLVREQTDAWSARPAFERTLLGFFNISSWTNFLWIAVGLGGQAAFFGRMFIQWVVSEKSRQSQVPELFWWLSFAGGVCLFTYFVWRVDVVGVLGQSTGVVIYARNLRLIKKQKRRERRGTGGSTNRSEDRAERAADTSGKEADAGAA
ncbi:MAG: lipid-A-disaccharide synthase N-terminal domain-containing protein [Planctomycetota bacterium]